MNESQKVFMVLLGAVCCVISFVFFVGVSRLSGFLVLAAGSHVCYLAALIFYVRSIALSLTAAPTQRKEP